MSLLQKKSDLGLQCLLMPFWQAACPQNFRTFTVMLIAEWPCNLLSIIGRPNVIHSESML